MKYLSYAFGEIILIVAGILLALQVDNWSDNVKDRRLETFYFQELREDLLSDTLDIHDRFASIKFHLGAAESLMEFIESGDIADTLSLQKAILIAGDLDFFIPDLATYNDLIGSGQISVITDKELKEQLDGYVVNYQESIKSFEEIEKQIVWFGYAQYSRKHYIDGRMLAAFAREDFEEMREYKIDWKKLRNDPEFKRHLTYVFSSVEHQWTAYAQVRHRVMTLVEHIDLLLTRR